MFDGCVGSTDETTFFVVGGIAHVLHIAQVACERANIGLFSENTEIMNARFLFACVVRITMIACERNKESEFTFVTWMFASVTCQH